MKNKKVVSLFSLIIAIVSLVSTIVYAGVSGFEVSNGQGEGSTSNVGNGGASGWVASNGENVKTRSGTRYVIRVQNEDGEYEDLGGKKYYDLFYLNHTYSRYSYNNSDNDSKEYASNEVLWSGTNYRRWLDEGDATMEGWHNLISNKNKKVKSVFSTGASSRKDYTKSATNANGETVEQARHVLTWLLNEKRFKNDNMIIYTDGFGLNDDDIMKLIDYEEKVANYWKTSNNKNVTEELRTVCENVLEQIEQIRAGNIDIQIRAEILMRVRPGKDCTYTKVHGTDTSAYIESVKVGKQSYYYFLTFRECLAIAKKSGVNVSSPMIKCASLLKETNEPWRSEAKYVSEAAIYGDNYWLGWDYIQFQNPYKKDNTTVTIKYREDDGTQSGSAIPNYPDVNDEITEDKVYEAPTIDGYEYIGIEEKQPEVKPLDSSKTKVEIKVDNKKHEIIFWYKKTSEKDPNQNQKVIVKYVQRLSDGTEIPIMTYSSNGEQVEKKIEEDLENGKEYTYYASQLTNELPGYIYIEVSKDGVIQTGKPNTVSIIGDGQSHEIIFVYNKKVDIKIIGVYENSSGTVMATKTLSDSQAKVVPIEATYKIKDYANLWSGYALCKGNPYFIQENNLFYYGAADELKIKNQDKINIEVDKNSKRGENTVNSILIVIYFEPNYTLDVNHWDVVSGKNLASYSNISLESGKKIDSLSNTNYLNLYYEWDHNGNTIKAPKDTGKYSVTIDSSMCNSNHDLDFYYSTQQVDVLYVLKENGQEIAERETKSLGVITAKTIKDYSYVNEYKLNNNGIKNGNSVTVSLNSSITGNQTLIFYYKIEEAKVTGTGGSDSTRLGVTPSDSYNQLIGQSSSAKYWVLNGEGTLTIRFEKTTAANVKVTPSNTVKVTFPFDIYRANGTLVSAGTTSNFGFSWSDSGSICTGTMEDVYVPIWVEEKIYNNNIRVQYTLNYEITTYTYSWNEELERWIATKVIKYKTENVSATTGVEVIGALYDFSITNLDGSDTTGDAMWKKALFASTKEYKANETAIGQGTQQSKNYNYGIKRGTRFYFSVNTIGPKNKKIEITPLFYYISNDGRTRVPVTMQSKYLNDTLNISLTDANRTTTEFQKERAKKSDKSKTTIFSIGGYTGITLDANVNTPYLGIVNEIKFGNSKANITDYANHWYGDYSIPNDAKFYKADGTQVDENGSLVVYFKIITKDGSDSDYLDYNGDSPFVQTQKISQWDYERKGNTTSNALDKSMTLPKTTTTGSTVVTNIWKQKLLSVEDSAATIIYSLKANVTTKQNVTSVGTH